jgi:integrase
MPDKSVVEVVDEFIKRKAADGCGELYIQDLRHRLGQPKAVLVPGEPAPAKKDAHGFADAFKGSIGHIDRNQIQAYLDGLNLSPRSRNNYLGSITSLFEFAKGRGYLPADWNELNAVEKVKDIGGKIEVFTPEEIASLLSKATKELLPFLAIGAFAGLRSAEIGKLEWADVKFSTGYIVVGKDKAKTAARRTVPMPENLKAWLAPYANASGRIWPHQHTYLYEVLEEITKAAKVPWKPNALRHSYISYRVAETGNVNATALEAGNSPAMIFSNYRELVEPEDAKRWFLIKPETKRSRKIITLPTRSRKSGKAQTQAVAVKA